jgi:hypothetical protein
MVQDKKTHPSPLAVTWVFGCAYCDVDFDKLQLARTHCVNTHPELPVRIVRILPNAKAR